MGWLCCSHIAVSRRLMVSRGGASRGPVYLLALHHPLPPSIPQQCVRGNRWRQGMKACRPFSFGDAEFPPQHQVRPRAVLVGNAITNNVLCFPGRSCPGFACGLKSPSLVGCVFFSCFISCCIKTCSKEKEPKGRPWQTESLPSFFQILQRYYFILIMV